MVYLIKILLVSSAIGSLILFNGCGDNKNLWNDVIAFFNKDNLTYGEIKNKMSIESINSVVGGDTTNGLNKIQIFFRGLSKHNYDIEKHENFIYVIFNKNDQIAAGPTIEVRGTRKDWYISDIRFGK